MSPVTQVRGLMGTGLGDNLSGVSNNHTPGHFTRRLVLGIIVSLLLPMVISKETRAVIIALHKTGRTGKSIAARKIERLHCYQKGSRSPRRTSKRQERLLQVSQLGDGAPSIAELRNGRSRCEASARGVTLRSLLEQGLVSRRAAQKPLLSRNHQGQTDILQEVQGVDAEDWGTRNRTQRFWVHGPGTEHRDSGSPDLIPL
ncbi:hypothetical protein GDO81_021732 [Engystomops pustulosus]|uniref:Uncharacterized protein n=1 Tax=Engystomops pustulosus TaxID=76066 RepID=A0AAV6Z5U3_ENGPU|nr:hypothetical protein GDO81_021732 [Engystomops pustulosus]